MAILKEVEKSQNSACGLLPDSIQDFTEGQAGEGELCPRVICLLKSGFLAFGLLFLFVPLNFIASILHFVTYRCSYHAPYEAYAGIWLLVAFVGRVTLTLVTKRFYPPVTDSRFSLAIFLDFSIVGGNILASTTIYKLFVFYSWRGRLLCLICTLFSMITTVLVWVIVGVIILLAVAINKQTNSQDSRHLHIPTLSKILKSCYEICEEELRRHFGGTT